MKTKELRAFCLQLARANAFGATKTDELTGERWTQTEVVYEKVVEQNESGTRKITLEEFQRGFNGLRTEQLFEFTDEAAGKGNVCMPGLFGDASPTSEVKPMFDIAKATVPEILKKYNELNPDKPVKRFADRKTAETRLRASLKKAAANAPAASKAAAPAEKPAKASPAAAATKKPRKAREPGEKPARVKKAAGPDRTGERYVRHHVAVGGKEYRSVLQAFQELGLPVEKHIKFRIGLKTSPEGKAVFKHDDKQYTFRLVAAAA